MRAALSVLCLVERLASGASRVFARLAARGLASLVAEARLHISRVAAAHPVSTKSTGRGSRKAKLARWGTSMIKLFSVKVTRHFSCGHHKPSRRNATVCIAEGQLCVLDAVSLVRVARTRPGCRLWRGFVALNLAVTPSPRFSAQPVAGEASQGGRSGGSLGEQGSEVLSWGAPHPEGCVSEPAESLCSRKRAS